MGTILHERCFYCNKVSSRDIETNAVEFTKARFFRDPDLPTRTACEGCKEVIEELMLDYEKQDDVYGWRAYHADNDSFAEDFVTLDFIIDEISSEDLELSSHPEIQGDEFE